MWWLAKFIQAFCIVLLLYALYVGVYNEDLYRELLLLGIGGGAFMAARQLEKAAAN